MRRYNEEPPLGACDVKLDPLPNLESESGIFHVLLFSYQRWDRDML